jgi:hypothetical protein
MYHHDNIHDFISVIYVVMHTVDYYSSVYKQSPSSSSVATNDKESTFSWIPAHVKSNGPNAALYFSASCSSSLSDNRLFFQFAFSGRPMALAAT